MMAGINRFLRPVNAGHVRLVYLTCLLAPLLFMLPALAGLAFAGAGRKQAAPLLAGHCHYLVSVLWRMAVYLALASVLTYVLIGVPLLVASLAWYLLRLGQGLRSLSLAALPRNTQSWLF